MSLPSSLQTPTEEALAEPNRRNPSPSAWIGDLLRNRRILSLADQAVVSVGNMCTTVIIARTSSKEQLGLYASGYSLALLAAAVQSALVSVPYTLSVPHLEASAKRLYKGSTLLQQLGLSAIATLLFLLLGLNAMRSPKQYGIGVVLLALCGVNVLICFRDFARKASYAELRFPFAVLMDGIASGFEISSGTIVSRLR